MPALGGRIKIEIDGFLKPSWAHVLAIPASTNNNSQKVKSAIQDNNETETWYV